MSGTSKLAQNEAIESSRAPDSVRPLLGIVSSEPKHASPAGSNQALLAKGITFSGEITGSEPILIDGKVEGSINLPQSRVTVGRSGEVEASINAREIVVMGKVRGNIVAFDRVDIRAEGSVTGDVTGARVCIEDGAFFKGGIDIRKPYGKPVHATVVEEEPAVVLKQA
ncbi:MAG: polymer-forming cytoskeletal protein [Terracidiphilus sp.]|nr:polymer-forming cytoskeletal protein [Terracidiphilus sp.]